jgi:hypothetical protein
MPARILVSSARGYGLSSALYGTYGRSAFNSHSTISGDLQDCVAGSGQRRNEFRKFREIEKKSETESILIKSDLAFHVHMRHPRDRLNVLETNVRRFRRDMEIQFGTYFSHHEMSGLELAKIHVETGLLDLQSYEESKEFEAVELVRYFNSMTEWFQNAAANALKENHYKRMFGVARDERIVLADPVALNAQFGEGTAKMVYGRNLGPD